VGGGPPRGQRGPAQGDPGHGLGGTNRHHLRARLRTRSLAGGLRGRPSDGILRGYRVIFLKAEATEFLEALPAQVSLSKIFILYPDPWPKKKHHKNRFISPENLDLLASRAAAETQLHFRTDNADYFGWTQEHLAAHPRWRIEPEVVWPFEQKTFFEERMKDRRDVFARLVK